MSRNWTEEEARLAEMRNERPEQVAHRISKAAVQSEAKLERLCTQMLEHDGWRSLKTNPVSRRSRGAGFGEVGMADYLYMRSGQNQYFANCSEILWIEWKTPTGINAEHQKAWQAAERAKGLPVWVAGEDFPATPEDFWHFYTNSGLKRQA